MCFKIKSVRSTSKQLFVLSVIHTCSLILQVQGEEKYEKEFYQNCTSEKLTTHIKCVGFPLDCIATRNCFWMGLVMDEEKNFVSNVLQKISNDDLAGGSTHIQYLSGVAAVTVDKSMTKVECRHPKMEDVKFFFLCNETNLLNKADDTVSLVTTYISKTRNLNNCTEEVIPKSKNSKYEFNLRYFLKRFSGRASTHYYQRGHEFADSIEYSIDPSKMLYYSKNLVITSSTSMSTVNVLSAGISILCYTLHLM